MSDSPDDPPNLENLPLSQDDLEKLTPELRAKLQHVTLQQSLEITQGPLPKPEVMAAYGEVVPGLPEKLVEWTENETHQRHRMDERAFDEVKALRSRAQLSGVIVSVLGIATAGIVGIYSAINDSFAGALVGFAVAIVSVGGPLAARILAGRWGGKGLDSDEQ